MPAAAPLRLPLVALSGAGLSAASGVPTFRGPGGWWRGRDARQLATPEAWAADPELVLAFYGDRRRALAGVRPNDGHRALVQLQAHFGADEVLLVTQNVDGLLQAAAVELGLPVQVLELHGGLDRVRCSADPLHPRVPVAADDPDARGACAACGARLRPDIVWFGEVPHHLDAVYARLEGCGTFLSVGTSGVVYPAAGFVAVAARAGALCVEVNPEPAGGPFDLVLPEGAEAALPRLLQAWSR